MVLPAWKSTADADWICDIGGNASCVDPGLNIWPRISVSLAYSRKDIIPETKMSSIKTLVPLRKRSYLYQDMCKVLCLYTKSFVIDQDKGMYFDIVDTRS